MPARLRRNGEVAVIELEGRLSLGEPVEEFRQVWNEALASGVRQLVVNLTDVTMMDSSGIGTMIRCHSAVMQQVRLEVLEERCKEGFGVFARRVRGM